MTKGSNVEEMVAARSWQGMLIRFFGFVLGSVPVFIVLFGLFPHVPLVGFAVIFVMLGLIAFPHLFDHFWGATRDFPRLLLCLSLLPALLFSFVLFIADKQQGSAGADAVAAAPIKEEKVVWSGNTLQNQTSRILQGVTLSCQEFYKNKNLAASVKTKFDFEDDIRHAPLLPDERRNIEPQFKISGSREDVDSSLRTCTVSGTKFAKEDKSLPIQVALFSRKFNTGATIKNTSNELLKISKLRLACVVINSRTKSDSELLDEMMHGIDGKAQVYATSYYPEVKVRAQGTSENDTKLEIPANGQVDVRLYKKGGFLSSDEELGVMDFSRHQCWVPD